MTSIDLKMEELLKGKDSDGRYFWITFTVNRHSLLLFSFDITQEKLAQAEPSEQFQQQNHETFKTKLKDKIFCWSKAKMSFQKLWTIVIIVVRDWLKAYGWHRYKDFRTCGKQLRTELSEMDIK